MSQQAARAFFDAWNRRDMDEAMGYIADDCHYDDFSFVRPHVGKAEVRQLFENVAKRAANVTFVIDDITGDHNVGVYWHIMAGDQQGPHGVSFYRFDAEDRLSWALDAADPGNRHNDFHDA